MTWLTDGGDTLSLSGALVHFIHVKDTAPTYCYWGSGGGFAISELRFFCNFLS